MLQRQVSQLNKAHVPLLKRKPLDHIAEQYILCQYEVIVDHVSPHAYEVRLQECVVRLSL